MFFFFPWNDPESALGHGDLGPDILNLVSWFLCLPVLWSWTKGLKLSNPEASYGKAGMSKREVPQMVGRNIKCMRHVECASKRD